MSRRVWSASAGLAQLPVRGILLTVLLTLGGWSCLAAFKDLAAAYQSYRQNEAMIGWAQTTNHLFRMAQHFAFERGRTAVVLRSPQAISEANRKFIDTRRQQADEAMQSFLQQRSRLPQVGQDELAKQWSTIQALREENDRAMALPLSQRDPLLAERWFASATHLLTESRRMTQLLVADYVRSGGMGEARLTMIAGYAFELRLILGAEASLIAQSLAAGTTMPAEDMARLHEMRGQEKAVWQEIDRLSRYGPMPGLDASIAQVRRVHHATLRQKQEAVLAAWAQGRLPALTLEELTSASLPVLDSVAKLTQQSAAEIELMALEDKRQAERALLGSLVAGASSLAIMLLAIWYVLHKVIRPLEAIDRELRQLTRETAVALTPRTSNEIACIEDAIALVTHLWQEKARLEDELRNFAFHDSLTLLPNRRLLMERIQQASLRNERRDLYACLLFLDLDKFKAVNDNYGHDLGDQLLIAVARRMKSLLREEDTVARLGGDEFIVLIDDLGRDIEAAAASIGLIVEKLTRELGQPYLLGDVSVSCSISIGSKIFRGGGDANALIKAADQAMYQEKRTRNNGYAEVVAGDASVRL